MVVGASGTLGQLICAEVRQLLPEAKVFIGDYQPKRGAATAAAFNGEFRLTDFDSASLEMTIAEMDIVIVAINQPRPVIQELCVQHGNICIDVTVFHELIDQAAGLIPKLKAVDVRKKMAQLGSVTL